MVNDMEMSLTVLPDWSEFDQQTRRKTQQGDATQSGQGGQDTQQQMVEEEQNQTQSLAETGAVLGFIAMILRDLKPILMLIELIFGVINLVLMPIAMLLYKLLAPVLIWIMQVLAPFISGFMGWMNSQFAEFYRFWEEIIQGVQNVVDAVKDLFPPWMSRGVSQGLGAAHEGAGNMGVWGLLNPMLGITNAAGQVGVEAGARMWGRNPNNYYFNFEGFLTGDTAEMIKRKTEEADKQNP